MGDDRFCSFHVSSTLVEYLLDEEDEKLGWELPDDDIKVPAHLLPSYQDEDDESVLPSASHPSYPYGNPHTITPHAPRSKPPTATHHSLATSLPVLSLPHLHSITTFGEPSERVWTELGLNNLLPEAERREEESEEGGKGKGEAMQPTGQNAGDFPVEEGEEEEGGE